MSAFSGGGCSTSKEETELRCRRSVSFLGLDSYSQAREGNRKEKEGFGLPLSPPHFSSIIKSLIKRNKGALLVFCCCAVILIHGILAAFNRPPPGTYNIN